VLNTSFRRGPGIPPVNTVSTTASLGALREALREALAALPDIEGVLVRTEQPEQVTADQVRAVHLIRQLVNDIDRQRATGANGHPPATGDSITITDMDGAVLYRGTVTALLPDGGFALATPEGQP
jgi:hypothetical protein